MDLVAGVLLLVNSILSILSEAKKQKRTIIIWLNIGLSCIGIALLFAFFHLELWKMIFAILGVPIGLISLVIRLRRGIY